MEALGINLQLFVAEIINFFILLGLLYLFAYKPVLKMLDERSRKVQESIEETERIKAQAASTEDEYKRRIRTASQEGQDLIARAARAGEEVRQQAREEAREEAEIILSQARVEINRERNESIDELRKELADLTIMAAEKVIGRSLDKESHKELIDKTMEESSGLKKS